MSYFSRRNNLIIEFSGHEEVSMQLRNRLQEILNKFVDTNGPNFSSDLPWSVEESTFLHKVRQEFLKNPITIIASGEYHEVLSVVEIFLELANNIYHTRAVAAFREVLNAFKLSGSVYTIKNAQVVLNIDEDLAKSIEETKTILAPFENIYKIFFEAIGSLASRKDSSKNILKDLFIASEGYLKEITGQTKFGDCVKKLVNDGVIHRDQNGVLDKLNAFASDSFGVRHAGSSPTPTETQVLWFLETMIAQIRYIDRVKK